MATFDCGRQRYSMNPCASHQRPRRGGATLAAEKQTC